MLYLVEQSYFETIPRFLYLKFPYLGMCWSSVMDFYKLPADFEFTSNAVLSSYLVYCKDGTQIKLEDPQISLHFVLYVEPFIKKAYLYRKQIIEIPQLLTAQDTFLREFGKILIELEATGFLPENEKILTSL